MILAKLINGPRAFCFQSRRATIRCHQIPTLPRQSHSGEVNSDRNFLWKVRTTVFAFILDTLGSTELIFILLVALIFFGPRKLPQLARSMGKGLAEFRKASDDFKRTWEREVALETVTAEDNSLLDAERQ